MSASHLLPSSGRADSVNSLHCPAQIDFRSSQKPPLQTTDSWLKSILSPAYVCRYEDHVVRHMTNRRSDLIHPAVSDLGSSTDCNTEHNRTTQEYLRRAMSPYTKVAIH